MMIIIKVGQIWLTKTVSTVLVLAQYRNASLDIDCRRKSPSFHARPPRMYLDVWQTSKMESVKKTTLTSFCWKLHFRCLISFLICLNCSIYLNMLKVLLHNFCIYLYVMVTHKEKYTTSFFGLQGLFEKFYGHPCEIKKKDQRSLIIRHYYEFSPQIFPNLGHLKCSTPLNSMRFWRFQQN